MAESNFDVEETPLLLFCCKSNLDEVVGLQVNRGGRLIQNQDLGFPEQSPSQTDLGSML
jgi:hypothetical protein